jgi:hypothetical protein
MVLKSVNRIIRRFSSLSPSIAALGESIANIWSQMDTYRSLLHGNEKAIEYLIHSLSLIADLPRMQSISVRHLIQHPDEIIALVDTAALACSHEKTALRDQLRSTSKSLSDSLSVIHRPPMSEPVARVLTNLGSVILDVHSQLDENHPDTLRLLLSGSDDDGSLNFDDDD